MKTVKQMFKLIVTVANASRVLPVQKH